MSAPIKPTLEVSDIACHFDVSPSWFDRTVLRRPELMLKAVDGLSFSIPRGTTYAIVGESGCGKSTLARMVVGLYKPTRGTLAFAPGRGRDGLVRTQMIFQDPFASLNPRWRVDAIVAEPIRHLGLRRAGSETDQRVRQLLEIVGLSGHDARRYPHEFSGGQRQRISIARALAAEPEFLVCDEPTSALDVSVQAQILNLLKDLQRELGLTYLFISHNLSAVRHVADRVAVMYLGRIVEEGRTDDLFDNPRHPYTRFLLETVPNLENPNRNRVSTVIDLPSLIQQPSGCSYHPRCFAATDICRLTAPEEYRADSTSVRCHHI